MASRRTVPRGVIFGDATGEPLANSAACALISAHTCTHKHTQTHTTHSTHTLSFSHTPCLRRNTEPACSRWGRSEIAACSPRVQVGLPGRAPGDAAARLSFGIMSLLVRVVCGASASRCCMRSPRLTASPVASASRCRMSANRTCAPSACSAVARLQRVRGGDREVLRGDRAGCGRLRSASPSCAVIFRERNSSVSSTRFILELILSTSCCALALSEAALPVHAIPMIHRCTTCK